MGPNSHRLFFVHLDVQTLPRCSPFASISGRPLDSGFSILDNSRIGRMLLLMLLIAAAARFAFDYPVLTGIPVSPPYPIVSGDGI